MPREQIGCEPQEDAHAIALGLADRDDAALFAIYDGHGGKEVAKFAAVHMVRSRPLRSPVTSRTAREHMTVALAYTSCRTVQARPAQ